MDKGKRICNVLKELRKRIAEANAITYEMEECPHKGSCLGTCPKCEQELNDISDQLHSLAQDGKQIHLKDLITEEELCLLYNKTSPKVMDDIYHQERYTEYKRDTEYAGCIVSPRQYTGEIISKDQLRRE